MLQVAGRRLGAPENALIPGGIVRNFGQIVESDSPTLWPMTDWVFSSGIHSMQPAQAWHSSTQQSQADSAEAAGVMALPGQSQQELPDPISTASRCPGSHPSP